MNLTKTVSIADEALPILAAMTWEKDSTTVIGRLTCGQLESGSGAATRIVRIRK